MSLPSWIQKGFRAVKVRGPFTFQPVRLENCDRAYFNRGITYKRPDYCAEYF